MKWSIIVGVATVFLGAIVYVMVTGRFELWLNLGAFQQVIATAETTVTEPLARKELGRALAVRTGDGTLLVRFDRGGGHLGAYGFLYCADAGLDLAARSKALGLAEGIRLDPLTERWSRYRSTEE